MQITVSETPESGAPASSGFMDGGFGLGAAAEEPIGQAAEPPIEELSAMPEWQLAQRVAASRALAKSEFMRGFLLYVCEQHLRGNAQEIIEQRIGTRVFNRPAGYNPGEDNIVRNYARMLRKRLNDYFEGEGKGERMRIEIPRGGYVPVFRPRETQGPGTQRPDSVTAFAEDTTGASPAVAGAPAATASGTEIRTRRPWVWLAAGLAAGVVLASAVWLLMGDHQVETTHSAAHALWAQIFQRNRNTLIISADSGLGILQNLTGQTVPLDQYANGTYIYGIKGPSGVTAANLNDIARQRYTSFVDLNIATQLTQLPEFIGNRAQFQYARSVSTEDLRTSNAILIGSSHTNPWASLFDKRLNFRLQYSSLVDRSQVVNEHPESGERAVYENGPAEDASQTFGTIDYVPSLDGSGHVLLLQGLNMAATQAAAEILFDSNAMRTVLSEAALPNGSLKSFELLIETHSIGANAPSARILATRFYPK